MEQTKLGGISFFQPRWIGNSPFFGGFSSRNGGVSRAPYNSLNLGLNTDDPKANVEANRSTFCRAFGCEPHQLLTVDQVHGDSVLVIDEENHDVTHFQRVQADAIVTNQPGLIVGVLVADCYPVLIADPVKGVVAAIHAGWRGVASSLISKTIETMGKYFGCDPCDLRAAIGAGIGGHQYEVDRIVRDGFREQAALWSEATTSKGVGKWLLDLQKCATLQLQDAGLSLSSIDSLDLCTCCHREHFFSYRRDDKVTGRQIGFIGIR